MAACIGSYFIFNKFKFCQYKVDTNDPTNEGETQDEITTDINQRQISSHNIPQDDDPLDIDVDDEGIIGPDGTNVDDDENDEDDDEEDGAPNALSITTDTDSDVEVDPGQYAGQATNNEGPQLHYDNDEKGDDEVDDSGDYDDYYYDYYEYDDGDEGRTSTDHTTDGSTNISIDQI